MENLTKGQLFGLNNFMSASNYSGFEGDYLDKYFTLRLAMNKEAEDIKKSIEVLREETKPEALKKEGAKETDELKKEWERLHNEAFEKSVLSKEAKTDTHIFPRSEVLKYVSCNSSKILTADAEWILTALVKEG